MLNSGVRKVGDGLPVRTDEGDIAQGDAARRAVEIAAFAKSSPSRTFKRQISAVAPDAASAARKMCSRSPPGKGTTAKCKSCRFGCLVPGLISKMAASIPSADVPDMRPMTFMSL